MVRSKARILFLLEYGAQDTDALRTATALTGEHSTEVVGLFVEDADLLGAAALPGFAEVSIRNQTITQLNANGMRKALAIQAQQMRALFESCADRLKLAHRFQIRQGRTIETLLQTAANEDVVIVGRPLRGAGLRARTGVQYADFATMDQDVLFVNEPWGSGSSILAVLDENASCTQECIEKAHAIAQRENLNFIIASIGDPGQSKHTSLLELADQVVEIDSLNEQNLGNLCRHLDPRLLVISSAPNVDWRTLLVFLLNNLSCSLLRIGQPK